MITYIHIRMVKNDAIGNLMQLKFANIDTHFKGKNLYNNISIAFNLVNLCIHLENGFYPNAYIYRVQKIYVYR